MFQLAFAQDSSSQSCPVPVITRDDFHNEILYAVTNFLESMPIDDCLTQNMLCQVSQSFRDLDASCDIINALLPKCGLVILSNTLSNFRNTFGGYFNYLADEVAESTPIQLSCTPSPALQDAIDILLSNCNDLNNLLTAVGSSLAMS